MNQLPFPKMSPELWARYRANPLATDAEVRREFQLPEHCYYSVGVWPERFAGEIYRDTTRVRVVRPHKISKSDA